VCGQHVRKHHLITVKLHNGKTIQICSSCAIKGLATADNTPGPYDKPSKDYPIGPIKFGYYDHELLASLHGGQSDPLYALISRTVGNRPTYASLEELRAAVDALERLVADWTFDRNDLDISEADYNRALSLFEMLEGPITER
jgi:hypothetical protein